MKKRFLIKTSVVFVLFIFFFPPLQKITYGKSMCEINLEKIKVKKCLFPSLKMNNTGYEIYPFEDLFIKI